MATEALLEVATEAHAEVLARTLRPEDVAEVQAGGLEPLEAVLQSVRKSDGAYALLREGELGCIFGVGPIEGVADIGQVWFLTAHDFGRHPRAYIPVLKRGLGIMLQFYPQLCNIIDSRYAAAVRWAKWLGFRVGEAKPWGPHGVPFHPASLRRNEWAP